MSPDENVNLFESVADLADQCVDLIDDFKSVPDLFTASCQKYQDICRKIPQLLKSGQFKIAVVGVIKSGKSTFVNAVSGQELVQRGAGAMTSITTRIRRGDKKKAFVFFRSWDQVNAQIENAIRLFPLDDAIDEIPVPFDLRRKKDRTILHQIYQQMVTGFPMADGQILPETAVVRHALQGFEKCGRQVEADENTIVFDLKAFERHKAFTSDSDRAFYVKDVVLEVNGPGIDPDIEIADCQGSDATDPNAIKQVLNYIENADLIVYCVSSRNGLRQSDLMFLEKIKKLGMLEQLLVVNNCDLTEHDNLEDLKKIESAVRSDLKIFGISPAIFSFSCLYQLYQQGIVNLSDKQAARLALWDREPDMAAYCSRQYQDFSAYFNAARKNFRNQYLAAAHLGRLEMVVSNLDLRLTRFLETLSSDQDDKKKLQEHYTGLYDDVLRLESIVHNSIDAAINGLVSDIETNLSQAFSKDQSRFVEETRRFIDQLQFDVAPYRRLSSDMSLNKILYLLFHDFRRRLDTFTFENIRPGIKDLVREQEKLAASHFDALLKSYRVDFFQAGITIPADFESRDAAAQMSSIQEDAAIDFEKIKEVLGIRIPERIFRAEASTAVKTKVWVEFFTSTFARLFSSALNRNEKFSFTPALKQANYKIKHYTQKQLNSQIIQYKQILLSQYVHPIIEAAVREFRAVLAGRFEDYKSLKLHIDRLLDLEADEKKMHQNTVLDLKSRIAKTTKIIEQLSRNHALKPEEIG